MLMADVLIQMIRFLFPFRVHAFSIIPNNCLICVIRGEQFAQNRGEATKKQERKIQNQME